MHQLPAALGVTEQAFSQLVDTFVLRGYVERAVDPADRRRVRLTLTERGRQVAALVARWARRSDEALLALVGDPADVATTRRVLASVTAIPGDLGVARDDGGRRPRGRAARAGRHWVRGGLATVVDGPSDRWRRRGAAGLNATPEGALLFRGVRLHTARDRANVVVAPRPGRLTA